MDRTRDRIAGVTVAALLQLGFVTIFIYSLPLIAPPKRLSREVTFLLPPLREVPKPNVATRRIRPSAPAPFPTMPRLAAPPIIMPPVPMPPPATDLQTFGNMLFGCAPENLGRLTPEQRSHCVAGAPRDRTTVTEPLSLVKDLPRREAELAARNTPARVPCVGLRTQNLGFTGRQETGVMVDPLCILNGWINGFGGLPP